MKFYWSRSRLANILLALVLGCLGLTVLGAEAYAQNYHARIQGMNSPRVFPEAALRGRLTIQNYPHIILDGKREVLAPGTRIMDTHNRAIQPSMIAGQRNVVNYMRLQNGQLHTIWLLSADEVRERRKSENPKWWEKLYNGLEPWIDLAKWYGLKQLGL